jgi:hypothetical protein
MPKLYGTVLVSCCFIPFPQQVYRIPHCKFLLRGCILYLLKPLIMKSIKLTLIAISIASAGLFAFKHIERGYIRGTIIPAEGAATAWAISATDTVKADIQFGKLEILNVKAGVYRLIVEAKPPYKNAAKDNIIVADGQPTSVGEIRLER